MLKIIRILSIVYVIFLTVTYYFYFQAKGVFLSPEFFSVLIPVTLIFCFILFLLVSMGRRGSISSVISSFDTVTIYKSPRRRRVWISSSWGADSEKVFTATFGKIKNEIKLKDVEEIKCDKVHIIIRSENETWTILTDKHREKIREVEKKIKETT